MKAIIAGAGIGGLTTALALHDIGWDVEIYESVSELKPLGVGINLLPHGSEVISGLGLAEALDATGVRTRAVEYRTKYGHLLASDPRGVEAGFATPQYSIHRGFFQFLLLDAVNERLGANKVHLGNRFDGFEQTTDEVVARFTAPGSGEVTTTATGDILIGADGFHSAVRKQLHPGEGPAHYSGMMMWRGANVQSPFLDGKTMYIVGNHDTKLVIYPISEQARQRGESMVNWVAEVRNSSPREAGEADWNKVGSRSFMEAFQDFDVPDLDLMALMENTETVTEYPMIDRHPLPWWTDGRVTLLGDAAHPMYPIGANGASQAILDARAIADCLQAEPDPQKALRNYESMRRLPTSEVVLANRESGPERVLDIADARLTGPDDKLEDLISPAEVEEVAAQYRSVAGFQKVAEKQN